MRISIDKVQTILSIIVEEDSIGLDTDQEACQAVDVLQAKLVEKVNAGHLSYGDILVTFE